MIKKQLLKIFIVILILITGSLASNNLIGQASTDGLTFGLWDQKSIKMANVPLNTTAGAKNTFEFWLKWNGNANTMPISTGDYTIYFTSNNCLGVNTLNGDCTGIPSSGLANRWIHVAVVFTNGVPDTNNTKFYINGQPQTVTYMHSIYGPVFRTVSTNIQISGYNLDYGFDGSIRSLAVWNTERTQAQIQQTMTNGIVGNEANLKGYWYLDPVTTLLVNDKSSFNHDGQGSGFSPPNLTASNINDLGFTVNWGGITGSSGYELTRNGTMIYDGLATSYLEKDLVSDTTYNYTLQAKSENGKSVINVKPFKTNVGELALVSVPPAFSLNPITLNGVSQKTYGSFGSKILVKDTRKVRDGWNLTVKASPLKSTDALRTFPNNKIQLKPVSNITQITGKIASAASIINTLQTIDGASPIKIVSASASTGQGLYEITLPANALELTIDPSNAYAKNYETNLTWTLVAGP